MTSLIPAPDIQPNLCATRNRHAGVDRLLVASAIYIEIRPEYRSTLPWLESDTVTLRITFNKVTPLPALRWLDAREVSPATRAVRAHVHHERAHSSGVLVRHGPVVVEAVMAADIVALSP